MQAEQRVTRCEGAQKCHVQIVSNEPKSQEERRGQGKEGQRKTDNHKGGRTRKGRGNKDINV